jgi:tRNA threonylcarbamoyladenosine biosynthesis protein TsaE
MKQVFKRTLGLSELHIVVNQVISLLKERPIVCLVGDLGAGKTTFVQHLATSLGVSGATQSPSFGIINEYANTQEAVLIHMDLYRLQQVDEFWSIGGMDYLESGLPVCIEWPEIVLPYLENSQYFTLEINTDISPDLRQFTLTY